MLGGTLRLKQEYRTTIHIARMKDNRWTKCCTEWQPRRGKKSRGRPGRRWQDDITRKEGTTWNGKATDRGQWKTLIGGGGGGGYIPQWMDKAQVKGERWTLERQSRGRYHGGRRPSSDDSLHSPTVIPPSALDKPVSRNVTIVGERRGEV